MLQCFYPDRWLRSAYEIDYKQLFAAGYRGIIFDIDNTLVEHGAPADERSKKLIGELKELGFGVMLLSNNKEPRVRSFNEEVKASYIYKAGKPGRRGYEKAMQQLGTNQGNTVFIGDQLFTDVWGAKRTGIFAILVQPIDKKEEIQIILKRYLEKIVLASYKRECQRRGKRENDN